MESTNKREKLCKRHHLGQSITRYDFFWDPFTAGISCRILEGQTQILHYVKCTMLVQVILLLLVEHTVLRPYIQYLRHPNLVSISFPCLSHKLCIYYEGKILMSHGRGPIIITFYQSFETSVIPHPAQFYGKPFSHYSGT
jgi:hypothetical protein